MNVKIENMYTMIADELDLRVNEKKMEQVSAWLDKLYYCLNHCDENEYGEPLLQNIMVFLDLSKTARKEIDDRVVTNTEYVLCAELQQILGGRKQKLQDIIKVASKDTVLPGGKWMWRGYRAYVKRNRHSLTVQFVAEKNGDKLDIDSVMGDIMEAIG